MLLAEQLNVLNSYNDKCILRTCVDLCVDSQMVNGAPQLSCSLPEVAND